MYSTDQLYVQLGTYLDHNTDEISYSDFINKELILFSVADNVRSIPCVTASSSRATSSAQHVAPCVPPHMPPQHVAPTCCPLCHPSTCLSMHRPSRSPSMRGPDGLKPSQRKVMWVHFKWKLKKKIKVDDYMIVLCISTQSLYVCHTGCPTCWFYF